MASYRYNVIIDVDINTAKTGTGKAQVASAFIDLENQARASGQRMTAQAGVDANKMAGVYHELYKGRVADEKKLTSEMESAAAQRLRIQERAADNYIAQAQDFYKQQTAAHMAAAKNDQKIVDETLAYQIANVKQASAFRIAETERVNKQIAANNAAQAQKIARSDPFQTAQIVAPNQVQAKIAQFNQAERDIQARNVNPFQNLSNGIKQLDDDLTKNTRSLGLWGAALKGAFVGAIAGLTFATIVSAVTGIIAKAEELIVTSVQLAAKFEMTRNAMTLFTGSARAAGDEIKILDQLARDTPGLRMEDAEQGAVRLRALGFEAGIVQNLVVGIAKQKLISGVDDEGAVQRVIINLQQLRAGSPQIQRDIQQMILSIPSLSIEIQKAFGSIDKFKRALREDPEQALNKFAKQMASAQIPAAGLTDAINKTKDAFIQAGRDFGEPFLEPLTADAKELTQFLYENKDAWKVWGTFVSDTIQGAINLWKELYGLISSTPPPGTPQSKFPVSEGQPNALPLTLAAGGAGIGAGIGAFFAGVGALPGAAIGSAIGAGAGFVNEYLAFLGEQERKHKEKIQQIEDEAIRKVLAKNLGLPTSNVGISLGDTQPDPNTFKSFEDLRKASLAEKARLESIADNKAFRDRDLQLLKDSFSIQEKALDVHHRYTIAEERKFQQDVFRLKQSHLREEFIFQNKYFDDQEKLADGDKKEIQAINIERAKALSTINAQIAGNAIEWEKKQSEFAAQEAEQRRQAAIRSAELLTQGLTDALTRRTSAIERGLAAGVLSQESAFQKEIDIANQTNAVILQGIQTRLDLELQNRSLTEDEKRNLRTQAHIEELQAEEDHIDKIFGIQQRRLENQRILIEQNTSVFIQSITAEAEALSNTLDLLFNDRSFSNRSNDLLNQLKNVIGLQINDINDLLIQLYDIRDNIRRLEALPPATAVIVAPVPVQPQQKRFLSPAYVPQIAQSPSVIIDATTGQAIPDNGADTLNRLPKAVRDGLLKTPPAVQFPQGSQTVTIGESQPQAIPTPLSAVPIAKLETDSIKRRSIIDEEITHLERSREILEDFFKSVKNAYDAFVPTAEGVDKFRADNLKIIQNAESSALQKQIDQQQKLVDLQREISDKRIDDLTKQGLTPEEIKAERKAQELEELPDRQKLAKLQDDQRLLEITHLKESNDLYQKSIAGITAYNTALAAGDPAATAFAQNRAVTARLSEEGAALEKLIQLQDRLKNSDKLDQLEIEAAKLQDIINLRHQEVEAVISINRSQAELSQKLVYSQTQADARVLEFLRSQKGITEIISDAKINAISTAYGQLDNVIGRLTAKMGAFGNVIKDLLSNLLKLALNSIFQKLFTGTSPTGGLFGGQQTGQRGGVFGGIGNILTGGGGRGGGFGNVGPGGTPLFNPNTGIGGGGFASLGPNPTNQQISELLLGQAANVDQERLLSQGGAAVGLPAVSLSGSLTQTLALAAPTVGFGIGSAIGGGSGLGGILGGIGGLALGGAAGVALLGGAGASIFATGGALASFGGAAALLTNPFTIAAGAALLVGAYFINRSKVRRKEEGIRDEAITSALKALDKLIEGVNNDRIDGTGALEQADQIRERYVQEMRQLKDSKTRRHALQDVSRLDLKIAQLKTAVTAQVSRKERQDLIVPTFADGGSVSAFAKYNPLGFQTGFGGGRSDNLLGYFPQADRHAYFSPTEYIMDAETTKNVGVYNLDLMRSTKGRSYHEMRKHVPVKKLALGGSLSGATVTAPSDANVSISGGGPITLELSLNVGLSEESFVQIVNASIKNANGSSEQLDAIVKSLRDQGNTELARVLAKQIGPILENK